MRRSIAVIKKSDEETMLSQRNTHSFDSGSHRRLSTVTRNSTSISMRCHVRRNIPLKRSKPKELHNSVNLQASLCPLADSNISLECGGGLGKAVNTTCCKSAMPH
jgi:hypothetical protein